MQNIIIEKPYEFIPPLRWPVWPTLIQSLRLVDYYLRVGHGVASYECRHVDRLAASLRAGHGVMLAPNHCRPCDPVAMGFLGREAGCHFYGMASWHLFHDSWYVHWALRAIGAFSVYREGIDRQAINLATDVLATAERPLLIFPEGAVTRTNDRLQALLDGVAFIARTAAKKRAKEVEGGQVVVHPVALKYFFQGDIERTLDGILATIEHRFSWRPRPGTPLLERITKVGLTLLSLKEIEHLGRAQQGKLADRLQNLIDRLLHPLEEEWLGGQREAGGTVPRVKALRMKILPDMITGQLSPAERQRRWDQLADIYLAQQVSSYPPDYLLDRPTVDRLLETVERFEEDLTDVVTVHAPLKVVIDVGEAIPVSPHRDRGAPVDPLMAQLERDLQAMLDRLALESPVHSPVTVAASQPETQMTNPES